MSQKKATAPSQRSWGSRVRINAASCRDRRDEDAKLSDLRCGLCLGQPAADKLPESARQISSDELACCKSRRGGALVS